MAAGGGDLERPAGMGLSAHVREIPGIRGDRRRRPSDGGQRAHRGQTSEPSRDLRKRADRVDRNALDEPGLVRVRLGDEQAATTPVADGERDAQDPGHRTHRPIQGELSDREEALERPRGNLVGGREKSEGDREVERGTLLARIGGGEVDRNSSDGDLVPGVPHRRPHPLARLPHPRVGEPDNRKGGDPRADVHLDLHHRGLQPHDRRALHPRQHNRLPCPL